MISLKSLVSLFFAYKFFAAKWWTGEEARKKECLAHPLVLDPLVYDGEETFLKIIQNTQVVNVSQLYDTLIIAGFTIHTAYFLKVFFRGWLSPK